MPAVAKDPNAISLGPGTLRWARAGTAEPENLTAAYPTGWDLIGYTEEGSEFSYELSSDPVEVAEEFEALFYKTTGRNGTVSFAMAENTVRSLTIALNGGTVTTGSDGSLGYEPPDPGTETRAMLAFDSEDGEERWIFRQVFQGGTVSVARRKGADKATLPVEFRLEKPANGKRPFKAHYAAGRSGGAVANPVTP